MFFLVNALRQAISRIDEHLQSIVLQELLNVLITAVLGLVVESLLVASARPQQIHYYLMVTHFHWPHHILYLHQTVY